MARSRRPAACLLHRTVSQRPLEALLHPGKLCGAHARCDRGGAQMAHPGRPAGHAAAAGSRAARLHPPRGLIGSFARSLARSLAVLAAVAAAIIVMPGAAEAQGGPD